jgi:hypothetical protein
MVLRCFAELGSKTSPQCESVKGLAPGGGQGQGEGHCRALVAAPGCWWPLGALAPSSRAGCRPAASAVGAAASRAPPCGRVSGPPPARMSLSTHRNLRAAFQKPKGVCRSTQDMAPHPRASPPPGRRGAQLPSPMALWCTHRSASSRVGRAPPVVASVHHSSAVLVRRALGAAYRGQCRYTRAWWSWARLRTPRSAPALPILLCRTHLRGRRSCGRVHASGRSPAAWPPPLSGTTAAHQCHLRETLCGPAEFAGSAHRAFGFMPARSHPP